mgnify:CR=1 FL=1
MPRSPKDNEEIRVARRAAIVAAATRVFAEKGFAKAKVTDIAAAAGLSHGLVYHYFPSKDAVFGAIAEVMLERLRYELALDHERAIDRIVVSLERRRETIEQPVDASVVVTQAMLEASIPGDVLERILSHFQHAHRVAVEWISEAQAQGDVDASVPPEELANALFCLVRGMSIRARGIPHLPFAMPRTDTILRLLRTGAPQPPRRVLRSPKKATKARPSGLARRKESRRT